MSPLSDILDLISQGVRDIEASYDAASTAFPSLDDPWKPSPLQAQTQAAADLVTAAASQLIAMVRAPHSTLVESSLSMYLSAALGVAERANVSEILRSAGPKGMHVREIGEISGVNVNKLGRFLRLLASHHIFREVEPDVFACNRLSSILDTGKTVEEIKADPVNKHQGTLGFPALMGHCADEVLRGCGYMVEYVFSEKASSDEPSASPTTVAWKLDVPVWEWYASPGNEVRFNRFGVAMKGTQALSKPEAIVEGPVWKTLKPGDVVVDVGGGIGSTTMFLAKKHTELKYVVQDRPETIAEGTKFFANELPSALESGLVKLEAHDFFTEQPVKNAAAFVLRMVLHDWPTAYAEKILRHLRTAALPSTKLILVESILPYACRTDETFSYIEGLSKDTTPAALLPNMGMVGGLVSFVDMQMMNAFNAQERTVGEFVQLGKATEWKLEQIYRSAPRDIAQLIYVPV